MMFCRNLVPLLLGLFLSGCAATTSDLPSRLLFPAPPEEPRMEFIGVYSSVDDLHTSKADQFRKSFLGASGGNSFNFPSGVAVDSKGLVYVSDAMEHTVKVIDFQKKTINLRFKQPSLSRPNGLAFDREGRLYVADSLAANVQVFAPGAEVSERTFTHPQMERPGYIAINDRLDRLYVSDAKVHRIFVFAKDGRFLFKFGEGTSGPELDGVFGPQGLAIAPDDKLYIGEIFNARISVFDADGNYLRAFGERGDTFWAFDHPKALAFDSEGHLYIADARRGKIVVYNTDGRLLLVIGGVTSFEASGFVFPMALAFNEQNRLFVADSMGMRLSVWQYMDEAYKKEKPVTSQEIKEIEDYLKRAAQGQVPPVKGAPDKP